MIRLTHRPYRRYFVRSTLEGMWSPEGDEWGKCTPWTPWVTGRLLERLRLRGDRAVLERDGEHDRGPSLDARFLPDLAEEILEVPGGLCAHFEHVVLVAGHAEAVHHLRELQDPVREV